MLPKLPYLASLPVLDWSAFLELPNPCRRQAIASPHFDVREWAILRPLLFLAIERGKVDREVGNAAALLFGRDRRSPFVTACEGEWRNFGRLAGALYGLNVHRGPVAGRLIPFLQWQAVPVPGGCQHAQLDGRVIPHGSPLLPLSWPPLSEECTCYLGTINLAKARRTAATFRYLAEEEVRPTVAPYWLGELAPVASPESTCAAILAEGEALLAAHGMAWPKRPALGAGLATRPAG